MSIFKPGPAKTLSGHRAYIYEVEDRIYGKMIDKKGNWYSATWELNGKSAGWTDNEGYYDLDHPNRPLYKAQLVIREANAYGNTCATTEDKKVSVTIKGYGKYKVTVEEIE